MSEGIGIKVRRGGLLTTVQDRGRFGYRGIGMPVSGALDEPAMRAANLLVGNEAGLPVLELTLGGPALYCHRDTLIALCGGHLPAAADGAELPYGRPIFVRGGTALDIGYARTGCRAYLAVAGGFQAAAAMGSASTYVRGGIGGATGSAGRALKAGDTLGVCPPSRGAAALAAALAARLEASGSRRAWHAADWFVQPELFPAYGDAYTVRAIIGPEHDRFSPEGRRRFWEEDYILSPQSDRMGSRLQGPALELSDPYQMVSEAVAPGTVQVPPNGQPIVLAADCQTTGGYPRIAHVAAVDLPLLAQMRPGQAIRFEPVDIAEAQELLAVREHGLLLLEAGVQSRIRSL
jgi:antagonist of KipI